MVDTRQRITKESPMTTQAPGTATTAQAALGAQTRTNADDFADPGVTAPSGYAPNEPGPGKPEGGPLRVGNGASG